MKIGEAASKSGLTERTVRLYEQRGLVSPEVRRSGGRSYREYHEHDVERLRAIAALRRSLFTVDEIAEMTDDPDTIADTVVRGLCRVEKEAAELTAISEKLNRTVGVYDAGSLARALDDFTLPSGTDADIDADVGDEEEYSAPAYDDNDDTDPTLIDRISGLRDSFISRFYDASGRLSPLRILAAVVILLAVAAFITSVPITAAKYFKYESITLTPDELFNGDFDEATPVSSASMELKQKRFLFRESYIKGRLGLLYRGGFSFTTERGQSNVTYFDGGMKIQLGQVTHEIDKRPRNYICYTDYTYKNLVIVIVNTNGDTEHVMLLTSTGDFQDAYDLFLSLPIELPMNFENKGDAA